MAHLLKRKLMKMGPYSLGIVLPKRVLRRRGWKEGQWVAVEDAGRGGLVLRDAKTRKR